MELSVTFPLTFARNEDFENTVVASSAVLLPALPQLSYVVPCLPVPVLWFWWKMLSDLIVNCMSLLLLRQRFGNYRRRRCRAQLWMLVVFLPMSPHVF